MQHPSDKQKPTKQHFDLEQQLTGYYGPHLREQPLPQDSWLQVRSRLKRSTRRALRFREPLHHIRRRWQRRAHQPVPGYVSTALEYVTHEARIPYPASLLHCTFKRKLSGPTVRVSSFRKRPLRLLLPGDANHVLPAPVLQVLLATGIARYQLLRRTLLVYLLCVSFVVGGACAATFYALHARPLMAILIVSIGGTGLILLLEVQKRWMVQRCYTADALVVLWLGRGRMCEGLHMLTNYTHAPYRSRWGEPALMQRIARVCGTGVEQGNERLTMVR